MITGAIIGGLIGLLTAFAVAFMKSRRHKQLLKTVPDTSGYSGLYHYATYRRFNRSLKFYDSYGLLYISGHTLYYKSSDTEAPLSFDLATCTAQPEPDWRRMKWFSISTAVGEKHYFNSHKMGAFTANSDETLKGLAAIQGVVSEAQGGGIGK